MDIVEANVSDDQMDSDESNNDDEVEGEETGPVVVSFDTSLPGTHSYLGDDLEDVRGRTVLDDESYLTMPLLSFPGIVLMPGQVLPLNVIDRNSVAIVKHALATNKTLGVILTQWQQFSGSSHGTLKCANVGTTAEVYSVKEELDEPTGVLYIKAKAVGRQRFEVMKKWRQIDGVLMARVMIRPENALRRALADVALLGANCSPVWSSDIAHDTGSDAGSAATPWKSDVHRCASLMTRWPPWVYQQYDAEWLMARIRQELRRWSGSLETTAESLPSHDATQFSFAVAAGLPLDQESRLHLLRLDCAVPRLRIELALLQKCTTFSCSDCGETLASTKDVFSLAREGPAGAYVNLYGHTHEILTVLRVKNLSLVGRASLENTWFPGYAWTIANCQQCGLHRGWKYTTKDPKLHPTSFWGLTRVGLVPTLASRDGGENEQQETVAV